MITNKNLYAVILAGGVGTRFWPMSRVKMPKQFLNIIGQKSLLHETLCRIRPKIKGSRIFIVTSALYHREMIRYVAAFKIPAPHILLEPEGKNTAPAIGWAAARIYKENKEAVMIVLPSDHLISRPKAFLKHIEKAAKLANKHYLVTLGIVPTRPETGYGYLKIRTSRKGKESICKVEQFVEKPTLKKAEQYITGKKYLWNSGMFIWRCDDILAAFQKHLPKISRLFKDRCDTAYVMKNWHKLPHISVDYGILEKADNVATIPAGDIAWSDVGSWESLLGVLSKDRKGNACQGNVIQRDCENSLIFSAPKTDKHSSQRFIAGIGLKDIIVVDTKDALLVCRKDLSQDVKHVVSILKKNKGKGYL